MAFWRQHAGISLFMGAWRQTQHILAICAEHASVMRGDDLLVGTNAYHTSCQEYEEILASSQELDSMTQHVS